MYRVWLVNFDYGHDNFKSLESALAYARMVCFEAAIYNSNDQMVATFHPVRGVTVHGENNAE